MAGSNKEKSSSSSQQTASSSSWDKADSQSTSQTAPVNYQSLMTPEQLQGITTLGPQIINDATMALQGYGLTPGEQNRQEQMLTGRISDYAGSMKDSVLGGYATSGVGGGVNDAFMKNLDTSKIMGFSSGLRDIEDMNQAAIQQKLNNATGFVTWAPPVASQSSSQATSQQESQAQSESQATSTSKGKASGWNIAAPS